MATKKVYDECCRCVQRIGLCCVTSKGSRKMRKPDMVFLFGKKELVTEQELMHSSEREQRRHFMEDRVLRSLYAELYSKVKLPIKGPNVIAHT